MRKKSPFPGSLPLWLRITLVLGLLSFVFTILGAISPFLIAPLLFLLLILFPGPDASQPRLVRLMPWLWTMGFLIAILLLLAQETGHRIFGPDLDLPSRTEMIATVVFFPALIWSFWKQHRSFRLILIFSTAASIGIQLQAYFDGAQETKAMLELIGNLSAELIAAIYVGSKYKGSNP
ncbi:MAG: hypothetical protein AB1540_11670 [Bdellovibrionota bacterium]